MEPKPHQDKSTGQLLKEILQLFLLFLWAVVQKGFKKLIKALALLLYWTMRGIELLVEFWNSNDTQEKKRKLIEACKRGWHNAKVWTIKALAFAWKWTKIGAIAAWQWTVKAFKALVAGSIWLAHATVELIIHMKPTIIKMAKATKNGAIAFWQWTKRARKASKIRAVNRRRAIIHFQHNGGVKGMLSRAGTTMKGSITSYMDEEQDEVETEMVADELFDEEIKETDGKAHVFGKKFYKRIKDIVEER